VSGHVKGTGCLPLPLTESHKRTAPLLSPSEAPALRSQPRVLAVPWLEGPVAAPGSRQ